ncbi:MAG: Ig-like domain-containing protein [Oscillospiraceae bacterium]|jgi:hypothetical protein
MPAETEIYRESREGVFLICVKTYLLLFLAVFAFTYSWFDNTAPVMGTAEVSEAVGDDGLIEVSLSASKAHSGDVYFRVSKDGGTPELHVSSDGNLSLRLGPGNYKITATDSNGYYSEAAVVNLEDRVSAVTLSETSTIYLPIDGTDQLTAELELFGDPDNTSIEWTSSSPDAVTVEDGLITAVSPGNAVIRAETADGAYAEVEVVSTDLFHLPVVESKPLITYHAYTSGEAELLDNALAYTIEKAGGARSRGAVVAAARFLTMQLDYKIPYFFENGRLDPLPGRPYADGEGRFYHKGLYLSEDKFELLDPDGIRWGPAIWGQNLLNWQDQYYFVYGNSYPNGLDCSGFVSWCMCQADMGYGDIGAGSYAGVTAEYFDIGRHETLTVDLLDSGGVKPGDLIGADGHVAIVAGMDRENRIIYIAESLAQGVKITTMTYERCVWCGVYSYVGFMDGEYDSEGVWEDLWESAE